MDLPSDDQLMHGYAHPPPAAAYATSDASPGTVDIELSRRPTSAGASASTDTDAADDIPLLRDIAGEVMGIQNRNTLPWFYFTIGFVFSLPALAVRLYLLQDMGLDADQAQLLGQVVGLPWIVKPLWGMMSDVWAPWNHLHRKPYVILGGACCSLSWLGMGLVPPDPLAVALLMLAASTGLCVADVAVDSALVESVRVEEKGSRGTMQSRTWMYRACGGATGATGSFLFHLQDNPKPRLMFIVTSVVAWFVVVSGLVMQDVPRARNAHAGLCRTVCNTLRAIRMAFRDRRILYPAIFIFIYGCTPCSDVATFAFFVEPVDMGGLGVTKGFIAVVGIVVSVAISAATWLFKKYWRNTSIRKFMQCIILTTVVLSLLQLVVITHYNETIGIDPRFFLVSDDVALDVAMSLSMLPLMIVAAEVVPNGVEGSVYAGMMSILNCSDIVSDSLGALIMHWLGIERNDSGAMNFDKLWMLNLICSLSLLIPLPFIGCLLKDTGGGETPRQNRTPRSTTPY